VFRHNNNYKGQKPNRDSENTHNPTYQAKPNSKHHQRQQATQHNNNKKTQYHVKKQPVYNQPPTPDQERHWTELYQRLELERISIQNRCDKLVLENGNHNRLPWIQLRTRIHDIKSNSTKEHKFLWRWYLHAFHEAQREWTHLWNQFLSQPDNKFIDEKKVVRKARQPNSMSDFWYRDFACADIVHMPDDYYDVLPLEIRKEYAACNIFFMMLRDTVGKIYKEYHDTDFPMVHIHEWKSACTAWIAATIFKNVAMSQEVYASLLFHLHHELIKRCKNTKALWELLRNDLKMTLDILPNIRTYKFNDKFYFDIKGDFYPSSAIPSEVMLNPWHTNKILPRENDDEVLKHGNQSKKVECDMSEPQKSLQRAMKNHEFLKKYVKQN
jgi:hypothetical protein